MREVIEKLVEKGILGCGAKGFWMRLRGGRVEPDKS
jgi:hypothetical protein